MGLKTLTVILLAVSVFPSTPAQGPDYFRAKLGKPSELYRHKSGADVLIDYDERGQVCRINISDPAHREWSFQSFGRLAAVAAEITTPDMKGRLKATAAELGDCTDVRYEDYERVFIEINKNACYRQWVSILFKRGSCPKPPAVRNLLPVKG
jgi:hypothetical protein